MLLADLLQLDCNVATDIFLQKYFLQQQTTAQNKEELVQLVSLLRRCPVGAEIACNLLFRASRNTLPHTVQNAALSIDQVVLIAFSLAVESLNTFPNEKIKEIINAKEGAKKTKNLQTYGEFIELSDRWKLAAEALKNLSEELVGSLPGFKPANSSTTSSQLPTWCSPPALRKFQQLVAELLIWFPPDQWVGLNALFTEAMSSKRRLLADSNLLAMTCPPLIILSVLKEVVSQLSHGSEGFTEGKRGDQGRRTAWERGRVSSHERLELIRHFAKWSRVMSQEIMNDIMLFSEKCENDSSAEGEFQRTAVDYIEQFSDMITTLLPGLVGSSAMVELNDCINWSLFSIPILTQRSRRYRRFAHNALAVPVREFLSESRSKSHYEQLSRRDHEGLVKATVTLLENTLRNSHPLLLEANQDENNADETGVISELLNSVLNISRVQKFFTTELVAEFQSSILMPLKLTLCHPSIALACKGIALLSELLNSGDSFVEQVDQATISAFIGLVFLRSVKIGDPIVHKYPNFVQPEILDRILTKAIAGSISTSSRQTASWITLVEYQSEIDDDFFTTCGEMNFSQRFASLHNSVKALVVQTCNGSSQRKSSTFFAALASFRDSFICNPVFYSSSEETYPPGEKCIIEFRIRRYINTSYALFDAFALIIENLPQPYEQREYLSLVLNLRMSFLDDNENRDLENRCAYKIEWNYPRKIPSHWHLLEYRRLNLIAKMLNCLVISESLLSDHLRHEMLNFLRRRAVVIPGNSYPTPLFAHNWGILDEHEDPFYLIRRKSAITLAQILALFISRFRDTSQTPAEHNFSRPLISALLPQDERANLDGIVQTFYRRMTSAEITTSESQVLLECVFDITVPLESYTSLAEVIQTLSPLISNQIMNFHNLALDSIESFTRFITSNGLESDRRRFLDLLGHIENIMTKPMIPNTVNRCIAGNFMSETTGKIDDSYFMNMLSMGTWTSSIDPRDIQDLFEDKHFILRHPLAQMSQDLFPIIAKCLVLLMELPIEDVCDSAEQFTKVHYNKRNNLTEYLHSSSIEVVVSNKKLFISQLYHLLPRVMGSLLNIISTVALFDDNLSSQNEGNVVDCSSFLKSEFRLWIAKVLDLAAKIENVPAGFLAGLHRQIIVQGLLSGTFRLAQVSATSEMTTSVWLFTKTALCSAVQHLQFFISYCNTTLLPFLEKSWWRITVTSDESRSKDAASYLPSINEDSDALSGFSKYVLDCCQGQINSVQGVLPIFNESKRTSQKRYCDLFNKKISEQATELGRIAAFVIHSADNSKCSFINILSQFARLPSIICVKPGLKMLLQQLSILESSINLSPLLLGEISAVIDRTVERLNNVALRIILEEESLVHKDGFMEIPIIETPGGLRIVSGSLSKESFWRLNSCILTLGINILLRHEFEKSKVTVWLAALGYINNFSSLFENSNKLVDELVLDWIVSNFGRK